MSTSTNMSLFILSEVKKPFAGTIVLHYRTIYVQDNSGLEALIRYDKNILCSKFILLSKLISNALLPLIFLFHRFHKSNSYFSCVPNFAPQATYLEMLSIQAGRPVCRKNEQKKKRLGNSIGLLKYCNVY